MKLSSTLERYLLSQQIIAPALINVVLNGLISWLVLRSAESIRYWEPSPIGPDLLLSGFLLPFITSMISSPLIARKVRAGGLERIPVAEFGPATWHRRSVLFRSLFLGALGVLLFALPTVLVLPLIWPEPLSLRGFVVFKALWSATLAVLVCPVIAVWAIQSESEGHRETADASASERLRSPPDSTR